MKYNGYGVCRGELRSITLAQKAQKLLSSSAIPSEIIKLDSSQGHGCSFGIEISCSQKNNADRILSGAGVTVKQWNRAD